MNFELSGGLGWQAAGKTLQLPSRLKLKNEVEIRAVTITRRTCKPDGFHLSQVFLGDEKFIYAKIPIFRVNAGDDACAVTRSLMSWRFGNREKFSLENSSEKNR